MVNYTKAAKYYIEKYKTRDPFTISKELGIILKYKNLSNDSPRGLFKKILKRKFIILNMTRIHNNCDLKMVMAHELGHAILHSSDSTFFLHDHTLYSRGKFEREANIFAAELLINTDSIDKHSIENYSIDQLSLYFNVPVELVKIKFNI